MRGVSSEDGSWMELPQACVELEKFDISTIELSYYTNKTLVNYGVRYVFVSLATTLLIVEKKETKLMSLVIKFYFTSSMLNMFRTLIHPSSGACDFSIVSPHWSCFLVSVCVGVSVWLGWGGIRVIG